MWAARLHGPRDLRIERVPLPPDLEPGEILLQTSVTAISWTRSRRRLSWTLITVTTS